MNYFAFFLGETGYIEKCLILLKYVGNPHSRSAPHITLRLFKANSSRYDFIRNTEISYLNIVEPGTFNFEKKDSKYVVFLKCESDELEELDYRPDFPFSRLHITLYEGYDFKYASYLYSELSKIRWNIKLSFSSPIKLKEKRLGSNSEKKPNYNRLTREIFGDNHSLSDLVSESPDGASYRGAELIIQALNKYISKSKIKRVEPFLIDNTDTEAAYFDESTKSVIPEQMTIPGIYVEDVKKPVCDAIFVTPPEYAKDMVNCALEAFGKHGGIHFGDSSIGTGSLYLALIRRLSEINKEANESILYISSAVGVDIDRKMAEEAYRRFGNRELQVILGDAISSKIDLGTPRNMMIVNPPYNRHEHIPKDYRNDIKMFAKEQTGINVPSNAGLYVYHMLIMDKWLADDGVGVWLIPTIFLQAKYGKALRIYLTEKVKLLRLHIYDEKERQFEKAMISTTIVVFKKQKARRNSTVKVSYGSGLDNSKKKWSIPLASFSESIDNWRGLLAERNEPKLLAVKNNVCLSDLFDIRRGIATGANEFFVIDLKKANELNVPASALKPILPKARFLKNNIVESLSDGYPNVFPRLALIDCDLEINEIEQNYPEFYNYLLEAYKKDSSGKSILDRTLVKSRKIWYKQEMRESPMFFLTYMGRGSESHPPLRFIYNKSNAVALNNYILMYPHAWLADLLKGSEKLCISLLECLNELNSNVMIRNSRVYSGGLYKLEPGELKKTKIYNIPEEILNAYNAQNSMGVYV